MSTQDHLRQTGILVRKVCELLVTNPNGLRIQEILDCLEELSMVKRESRAQNDKILRRYCIAPVHAGWLTVEYGHRYLLTVAGQAAYDRYENPEDFMSQAGKLSKKGWLSLHFPRSYTLAGRSKDLFHAEIMAIRRIGLRRILSKAFMSSPSWEQVLPLQQTRSVGFANFEVGHISPVEQIKASRLAFSEGGHALYLSPDSLRLSLFRDLAGDYPPGSGLKIVKNPGGVRDGRYINNVRKGDSQIHLSLVHGHGHLLLVAGLLFNKDLGPRFYDLLEFRCGGELYTAYVVEHVGGPAPSMAECATGVQKLRELEEQELIRVILPEGFSDEEFACPECGKNAFTDSGGKFKYVDFQNFMLVDYESHLREIALEATDASHFGETSAERGGRYLYQSVPGVDLPAKRSVEERAKVLVKVLENAGVSLNDRLVLDIGCNIGMMMGQYLKLGARWCHGWDRAHVTPHTEKLLVALGCTRFSTTGGDISPSQPLDSEIPAFLSKHLHGCAISYLAVHGHIGWLDALSRIPWKFLIYEGHEGEKKQDFDRHIEKFRAVVNFKVAAVGKFLDGDSDERILAILVRSEFSN